MLNQLPPTDTPRPMRGFKGDLTVYQAVQEVRSWLDLSDTRRRDLTSALSSAARSVGLPPDAVLLTPAAMRSTLLARSAGSFELSSSSYKNMLSALRFVMRRLEIVDDVPPYPDGPWGDLIENLSVEARRGLMTFSRYCSREGIQPEAVDVDAVHAFEKWLTERNLCARPKKSAGDVRSAWNLAVKTASGWPQRTLGALSQRGQYVLPLDAFPITFQSDLTDFGQRLGATTLDDSFAEVEDGNASTRPRKQCRATTVELRKSHARWAASALVATGELPENITSLASLVKPIEQARTILRFFHARSPGGKSAAGMHVGEVLRIIAKHHVGLSDTDVKKIGQWRDAVALQYRGMTDKNASCVRQAIEPRRLVLLRGLPCALMKMARFIRSKEPNRAASLALRAVAIAILLRRPLRLSNLIGLRLDSHLQRDNPPRGLITYIAIPSSETKNKNAIMVPVPRDLGELLQEWIDDYRPFFAEAGCTYLFPGSGTGNRSMCRQGMHEAIKKTVISHVGVSLNPHRFRHLAAIVFLKEHPGEYETVRRLLCNKDLKVIINSYCGTEVESAAERFDEIIDQGMLDQGRHTRRKATHRKATY